MSTISASTTSTTAYKVTADTTGTLVLQTGSTPTTAVTVGTDQSVTLAGTLAVQSQNISPYTGFKNRIINGAMMIDQRNSGATVSGGLGGYSVDRWNSAFAQAKFNYGQSTTAPAGFINSLLHTVTAAYTAGATDYFLIQHFIEGLNVADLSFGTASAATVTVSFWVRSSVTGTYSVAITNGSDNRAYTTTFTVNSANTFEYKSVTIPGDQSGTWATNTGKGISVKFDLGSGSNYVAGSTNAWVATNTFKASGSVSLVENAGATFYITGVQLEKGSTATSFDYRPYGTELQLCQRYAVRFGGNQTYETIGSAGIAYSTTNSLVWGSFPVSMRSTPSVAISGNFRVDDVYSGSSTVTSLTLSSSQSGTLSWLADAGGSTGLTTGRFYHLQTRNDATASALFSAEL